MGTITIQEKVFNVTIEDKDTQSTVTINPASATRVNISEKGFVGGTVEAVWGLITGTLSDQADLQAALSLPLARLSIQSSMKVKSLNWTRNQ